MESTRQAEEGHHHHLSEAHIHLHPHICHAYQHNTPSINTSDKQSISQGKKHGLILILKKINIAHILSFIHPSIGLGTFIYCCSIVIKMFQVND